MRFGDSRCALAMDIPTVERVTVCDTNRHCNAWYEWHISMDGVCVMDIDGKEYSLGKGDALLIAPGKYHCLKDADTNHQHFILPFSIQGGELAKEIGAYATECQIYFLTETEMTLCGDFLEEIRQRAIFWRKNLYSICVLLLSRLFRRISDYISHREKEELSETEPRLGTIDTFFEECMTEECTEENLAGLLNLSRRQLQRVLMKYYGMGFREKRRLARLDHAGWLLRTTGMSISRICEIVGYQSEPSFFKAFKDHYGISPAIYRQESAKPSIKGE